MLTSRSDIRELIDRECSFPASRSAVVEAIGETTIQPPDGSAVALAEVIDRTDEARYATATELHHTVLANLGDDHVGRSSYDDRSGHPTPRVEVSF